MAEKIKRIKLLILDADGVMTDGSIIYTDEGAEIKAFNVRDGHGIKLLMRAGIGAAIITARDSLVMAHRARNLGITDLYQGRLDKTAALDEILKAKTFNPLQAAYIGDDIIDLPVLRRVGFSIAVADAVCEVRERVDYVTSASGGRGAIREVVELILKTQGRWDEVMKMYLE
ncbi:MAG: HAD hydrolase family protein [Deltaproteobacteria bacterium]|nr:HAD hydrolase family protein [Deltaproteobacteria bacterium]